ncbi:MAG: M28 family peptidase [Muribaculaceae bacterium]|nr:M28 family peptidase [Muribaculaceae bacterium]
MRRLIIGYLAFLLLSCGSNSGKVRENLDFLAESESAAPGDVMMTATLGDFDADSAYNYLAKQVAFGPRVPNTEAHRKTGDWLSSELKRHGAKVTEQKMQLKAFDGTILDSRNIFAQFNPESKDRILLLAHWDCRPWADKDPDPSRRTEPVDGANDGASGVAVLLEIARQLAANSINKGVDILFVDAEDWGTDGDEDSWALGTQYFVEHPIVKGYSPREAILLDMVGGEGAIFCREYFSERSAPEVAEQIWQTAHQLGYDKMFLNRMGSAVMDDHVQLIKAGIPAIDIIEYHPNEPSGFNSRWHTTSDNMEGISKTTLKAVGVTLLSYLNKF